MLVLTRKQGESVLIGDGIEITVQAIKGEGVRLAITAPKEVQILRAELKETEEINREASAAPAPALQALRESMKKGIQ